MTAARGALRIYLGAAPGVGKTFAMLDEAHRRADRGADVVVAVVETHGREKTAALLAGLDTVPRREIGYRGSVFGEMDLDAVLARRPEIALVDELAHTNVPGSRNAKRYQDVQELLDAGIDVISTINVQHLASLNDVVETITGVPQRETVPDELVRQADQVELVDIAPQSLRRRMAHGNIYAPEKVDAALSNYFRVGNLTALRELALLWLAGTVDEQLDRYRAEHGIAGTWETRERVVVALTGGPEGTTLIRRAARIAARSKGADLLGVHVVRADGLVGASPAALTEQRSLLESLGGSYHQVIGEDVPTALLAFARAENATQLVMGTSRRGTFARMLSSGVGVTTTRLSGSIDVHMVTHEEAGRGLRLPSGPAGLNGRRRVWGALAAVVALPALTAACASMRSSLDLTSDILLFLLAVVAVALVGGFWPAMFAAFAGSMLLNYYFTPPVHQWTIAERNNALALAVFVAVGIMVSRVVDLAARRSGQAARATAEAETLSTLAGDVLRGEQALPALLERVREAFGLASAALLERVPAAGAGPAWRQVATVGPDPCRRPGDGDTEIPAGDDLVLVLCGRVLRASDRRVLAAFGAQAAVALRQRRLTEAAAAAAPLVEAERVRSALLAAVSHDLRAPLASAKAAVTSLRDVEIAWTPQEMAELLATADESLETLTRLVENLLDMSRLSAGALRVLTRAVGVEDVLPRALDDLGQASAAVRISIPPDLPEVRADPILLERIIVNLVANALRYTPPGTPLLVSSSHHADRVEVRVVDRGPGIPEEEWDRVFVPFQRLGDRDTSTGVGLGLALSRGLAEVMGGSLTPEHTPGGGLTMVLSLPVAAHGSDPGFASGPGFASEP
jgi:two-component system, OmpR family, sensor histidine kinase KdpD